MSASALRDRTLRELLEAPALCVKALAELFGDLAGAALCTGALPCRAQDPGKTEREPARKSLKRREWLKCFRASRELTVSPCFRCKLAL